MSTRATLRTPVAVTSRPWLVAVVALTVLTNLAALVHDLARSTYLNVYSATQYYLTWQDGFFRRAFPGTVLHLVLGRDPSLGELRTVITVVTLLGLVATAVLVVRVASLPLFAGAGAYVACVLVASPLTFSMVLHNRSRLDPVVVLLLLLLALLPATVLGRRWTASLLAAGLGAAAVGSLELAVGFVAAVALGRAHRGPGGRGRLVRLAVELAPAAALALASLVLRPSAAAVDRVAERFARVGIAAPRENSVSVLTNTLPQALDLNRDHHLWTRVLWFVVFLACFAVTVVLLRRLVRPGAATGRVEVLALAAAAGTACAVSIVGFDYGRWFALALVALLGSLVALHDRPRGPLAELGRTDRRLDPATTRLLVVVLAVSLLGQHFPVYPAWG